MKTKLLFLITFFFTYCETYAQVTLPFYEGFNYTTNDLLITSGSNTGLGSWNLPFSANGSSSDPFVIDSPTWSLPTNLPAATGKSIEYVGGGDDPVITIPNQGSTGVIYSSFVFRITDLSAVTVNNPGYFYSFAKVASNGTSLNYTSCVYATKVTETSFNLGISENNNTTNAVFTTTPLTTNTSYFIVISYDIDNAVSSMWINPLVNGTEPTTTYVTNETATATRTDLTMVRLNLDSNARTGTFNVDEIRIGNTWNDVVPLVTASVDTNSLNEIYLYPNPVKNTLNIDSKNVTIDAVLIFSIDGKEVLNINKVQNSVDVSSLTSGIYIIKITSNENVLTRKIIIE
jgi:hypothetical protein